MHKEQRQMRNALADWVVLDDDRWHQLAEIFHSRTVKNRQDILLPHTSVHEIYDAKRFTNGSDRSQVMKLKLPYL